MKTLEMLLEYFKRNRLENFAILIILAIILYGVLGSIFIMHLNIYDSIYYTIITIATVGYGDITPITPLEKIFTVTLILAGVGLLAYILTFIISSVTENLQNRRSGRIMAKRLAEMENHYVLCGFGRVGLSVFEELKKNSVGKILVENSLPLVYLYVESLQEEMEIRTFRFAFERFGKVYAREKLCYPFSTVSSFDEKVAHISYISI